MSPRLTTSAEAAPGEPRPPVEMASGMAETVPH